MALLAARSAQAQTYKVLYSFTGGADGSFPGGLTRDAQGNLYGTTRVGGAYGDGTVFKLSKTRKETVLYSFTGGSDGGIPMAGVIRDAEGNLYGTTYGGGAYGPGTVFKLSKTRKETVLYSFCPTYNCPDGESPSVGVIQDGHGNLYGTTFNGGAYCPTEPKLGCGVVFKVSKTGKETVLYAFKGGADGGEPGGGVIQDAEGNLYGTTHCGGDLSSCEGDGCGTVFKLSKTGKETVLYAFKGGADGGGPYAGVIQDAQGSFYGNTLWGGAYGRGVVFKLSKTGKETALYAFTGGTDGGSPAQGLVRDAQGNLYGITINGGDLSCGYSAGCGVLFKVSKAGKETVLHSFTGGTDGASPQAVIQGADGNLYGTTLIGGTYGSGVVFKLTP